MKNGEMFFLGCFNNCYDSETKLCLSLEIKGFLTKIDAISHMPSLVSQRNARVITSKITNKEMCYWSYHVYEKLLGDLRVWWRDAHSFHIYGGSHQEFD